MVKVFSVEIRSVKSLTKENTHQISKTEKFSKCSQKSYQICSINFCSHCLDKIDSEKLDTKLDRSERPSEPKCHGLLSELGI